MRSGLKLLAAAAAMVIGAGNASAADVAVDAYGYDWSGFYLGAHAGYLWGEVDADYENEAGGGELEGFWGGALGGYNLQHDRFVFGAEGDFGLGGADGNGACYRCNETYTYSLDWNAHLRARAGFAVDRTLFFAAGGLAMANHELGIEHTSYIGDDSQTHYGWTLGGGIEYALTDNVLLRAEYLYDDYGDEDYRSDEGEEYTVDLTAQTVRAAISFKF